MASGQDLVKIAQAENGTKENGTNNVKYNTWFYGHEVDGSNYPWCAVFVSWCADKAGITTDIMPNFLYFCTRNNGMHIMQIRDMVRFSPIKIPKQVICF